MVCKSPEHMVRLCVSALKETGLRAIVLGGYACQPYCAEPLKIIGDKPCE